MTKEKLFEEFKNLLAISHKNDDPTLTEAEIAEIRGEIEQKYNLDSPLSTLGLDSMKMTWLIVRFEEALDIDASGLSFFELFDVNDLIEELSSLIREQKAGPDARL